jgi:hypothetical protein
LVNNKKIPNLSRALPFLGAKPDRPPEAGAVDGNTCANCFYGKPVNPAEIAPESRVLCRREPPRVLATPQGPMVIYSQPQRDWWCGEHKVRPPIVTAAVQP